MKIELSVTELNWLIHAVEDTMQYLSFSAKAKTSEGSQERQIIDLHVSNLGSVNDKLHAALSTGKPIHIKKP